MSKLPFSLADALDACRRAEALFTVERDPEDGAWVLSTALDRELGRYAREGDARAVLPFEAAPLADAIRAAVESEREACAALCEQLDDESFYDIGMAGHCATKIRARGDGR